jgi:hypothetical protein
MNYKSLEHSIRSVVLEGREKIKAVARPEDNRKELENVPRENTKDQSAYTRMQEIKKKIIDEEYLPELTLEEIEELHFMISNLLDEKKKVKGKIPSEEPEGKMGTKVDTSPEVSTPVDEASEEENIAKVNSIAKELKDMATKKEKPKLPHVNDGVPDMFKVNEEGPKMWNPLSREAQAKKETITGKIKQKLINKYSNNPFEKEPSEKSRITNPLSREAQAKKETIIGKIKQKLINKYSNNPFAKEPSKKSRITNPLARNEEVEIEFSEEELAHFNSVLEARGRPKKDESNPNTGSGRDPRQHIQVIAGQAAGGRNIEFTHNNGDKSTISPSMGRKIVGHLEKLKPVERQSAVNKMHDSAKGLDI